MLTTNKNRYNVKLWRFLFFESYVVKWRICLSYFAHTKTK